MSHDYVRLVACNRPHVSLAELIDRASILMVKRAKLPDSASLDRQYDECLGCLSKYPREKIDPYLQELHRLNSIQWVENEALFDALDEKEPLPSTLGEALKIINHIRIAHDANRQRVAVKNRISAEFGGDREAKSWDAA